MNIVLNSTPNLHKLHHCTCSTPCLHRFDLICTRVHKKLLLYWVSLLICTSLKSSVQSCRTKWILYFVPPRICTSYITVRVPPLVCTSCTTVRVPPLVAQVWQSHDKLSLYWVSLLICTSLTSSAQSCITNDIVLSSPLICSSQYCTLSRISSLHDPVLTNAQVPLDCATFSRSFPTEFADIYPVEVFCWIPLASYLANL